MKSRRTRIEIDIRMVPEPDELFRALPGLKESLELNVELAASDPFIPPVPCSEESSLVITRQGRLTFRPYDSYSPELAKIERRLSREVDDVINMLDVGPIDPTIVYFGQIDAQVYRYRAVGPPSFRHAAQR